MPSVNPTFDCPFCKKSVVYHFFLKHMLAQHFSDLFNPSTDYGTKNIAMLQVDKQREQTVPKIHLPNNESKYICLGCSVSINRLPSAQKHFPDCGAAHLAATQELRKSIPTAVQPTKQVPETSSKAQLQILALKKLVWKLKAQAEQAQYFEKWVDLLDPDSTLRESYKEDMPGGWDIDEDDYIIDLDVDYKDDMKYVGCNQATLKTDAKMKYQDYKL